MRRVALLLFGSTILSPTFGQGDAPNFQDHVEPILRENCLSCHKGSRAKNGLQLRSTRSILEGGSSGPAIVPGDAAASLLVQAIAHEREPFMPPDEPRLGDELIDVVRAWIDGGARSTADDKGQVAAALPSSTFVPPPAAGEAVMPEGHPTQPIWSSEHADAVVALAASPTSPLVAVGGHRQVSLYRTTDGELMGVLPFPEGSVCSLSFAASGALLVAGGGRAADSGLAVGWDVRSGRRVFTLGDEPDAVLAADVSVDHGTLALGGPDRVLRAYSTRDGRLIYENSEHTDWITAVAFSPDGVLLASADRAGGVFVWEALTGREFHALPPQKAPVTSLAWRADSVLLAVAADSGQIEIYEMEKGKRSRRLTAHGGVQDVCFERDGDLVSCGRDGKAFIWGSNGKRKGNFNPPSGLLTSVCSSSDGQVLLGDFEGRLHIFGADAKSAQAVLRPNPTTDEERAIGWEIGEQVRLTSLVQQVAQERGAAGAQLEELRPRLVASVQVLESARAEGADATARFMDLRARLPEARKQQDALEAPLQRAGVALQEAVDSHAQTRKEQERSHSELENALPSFFASATAARMAPGDQGRQAASKESLALVDEATRSAQLHAARHAEQEVLLRRRQAERQHLEELQRAAIERVTQLQREFDEALQHVASAHVTVRQRIAERADQAVEEERLVLACSSMDDRAATLRKDLEQSAAREARAREDWSSLQTVLQATGGHVPSGSLGQPTASLD